MELDHLIRAQSHGGSLQSLPESHGPDLTQRPMTPQSSESHPLKAQPVLNERSINEEATQEKQSEKIPTVRPHRSFYIVVVVLIYIALAVWSWATLVKLTSRPITANSYGYDKHDLLEFEDRPAVVHGLYQKNEQYYQAARFFGPVLAVLAIPLTSAVCAKAAVAYMQRAGARQLTLRQSLVIADRGWSDPRTYQRLLSGDFKRYGSVFLCGAMILSIIGASVFPLQTFFVSSKVIKTPTTAAASLRLNDFLDNFDNFDTEGVTDNLLVVRTRAALASTDVSTPQSHLWSQNPIGCPQSRALGEYAPVAQPCHQADVLTFANLSALEDPFVTQLSPGFNTGLIRQFMPRINSSSYRQEVAPSDYPTDCNTRLGALWAHYGATDDQSPESSGWGTWSLEVCMPGDQSHSPWRATRQRQDFSEELYLNISLTEAANFDFLTTPQQQGGLFKITVNTTAGYFELPNYMNGQQPGDLLDIDPIYACSSSPECATQGQNTSLVTPRDADSVNQTFWAVDPFKNNYTFVGVDPFRTFNKGPLLTIALALFGTGSYIADRAAHPEAFYFPNETHWQADPNYGICVGQAPLSGLLRDTINQVGVGNPVGYCLTNTLRDYGDVQEELVNWVFTLYYNYFDGYEGERIENAFTAAAFIANDLWLNSPSLGGNDWSLAFDLGADTTIPVISPGAKIAISLLLGIFLAALLGLAIYAACVPRWTDHLNGFALLRLGAALSDDIHLRIAHDQDDIEELDRLPGWVGDATNGEGPYGELGLGVGSALRRGREYTAYHAEESAPAARIETGEFISTSVLRT